MRRKPEYQGKKFSEQGSEQTRNTILIRHRCRDLNHNNSHCHSTTSFSENVVVAKKSYQMLGILSFSDRARALTSFNGNKRTDFW